MKSTADQLAQRLATELGADAVSLNADLLTSHSVDGKQPALVCTPDREQVSAALRLCAEADATVSPWGGGTAMLIRGEKGELLGAVGVTGDTQERDEELAAHGIRAAGLKTDEDCANLGTKVRLEN